MRHNSEREMRRILGKKMEVSDRANERLREVYDEIRAQSDLKPMPKKRTHRIWYLGGITAAAALCAVTVSHPVAAEKLPIIGHIFSLISDDAPFPGDYSEAAKPLVPDHEPDHAAEEPETQAYTKTANGLTMTLSEIYCSPDPKRLYLTTELKTEDAFPDTFTDQFGNQQLQIFGTANYSYNQEPQMVMTYLSGHFQNDHTYIGVFEIDLDQTTEDASEYWSTAEVPDTFSVHLAVSKIVGMKAGYSEYDHDPSSDCHYWYDGPFEFDLTVTIDRDSAVTIPVDGDSDAYHVSSVTKTPFELKVNEAHMEDPFYQDDHCILLALDANGMRLKWSNSLAVASMDEYQIVGRNVQKIDLYLITWDQYESLGIKGNDAYYTSPTDENGISIRERLEQNAKYHREVVLE